MKSSYLWIDGKLVNYENATVHVLNPTMHYGTGIFEGVRCYETAKGAAVFRLREHMLRLIESVHIVGIEEYPYSASDLYKAVMLTIRANGFSECYVRPFIYMAGPLTIDMDDWQPVTCVAVWEWAPILGKDGAEKGARVSVSSFTRHHPNITMTKAKITGNYVNSTLAMTLAKRSGFDEAILLDSQGLVAECSGENIFLVRDGVLFTPPLNSILEGITRNTVINLALDEGYQVVEEPISRDQLYIADEVFLSGTASEVVPVVEIDHRPIHNGRRGPVTQKIQTLFHQTVKGMGAHSAEWLDYVDETVMAV